MAERDYNAYYITGGGYDTIVIEKNNSFVTALTVGRQEINDFLTPIPEWENWHGDDDQPEGGYEHYYGGIVIAMRLGNQPPTIFDFEKWRGRLDFFTAAAVRS